jgi:Cu(I)/Ag(I) efflux system membrane fusion protein
MKRMILLILIVLLFGTALGTGYWLGQRGNPVMMADATMTAPAQAAVPVREPLYYQHPSGEPDYSPTPKKTEDGRDYVAVYDEESQPAPADTAAPKGKGKILYYRNPMGLPDTSPAPKKDSMGMDYIPVYEGEDQDDGSVKISLAKVQRLGVRTEPVQMRELARSIRAVGTVQIDESRLAVITTKVEGYIEKLLVNTTGQTVRRGQPVMEVYSPALVQAQQEYLVATENLKEVAGMATEVRATAQRLVDGAIQRLRYLDVSPQEIERLKREGVATRRIIVRAPANGIVIEKPAIEGMRFMPGEMLLKTVDLSTVWLIAEVFEQDLGLVREGESARITVNAFPGEAFTGTVEFIYPTLSRDTRTARVRVVVPNPNGRLRADMYASVELMSRVGAGPVLAVPDSAVINSGTRQAVLVERGEGRYEPREVKIGAQVDGFYEIREGLKPDEKVVVSANFLIDAESNLRAALRSFTTPDGQGAPK